MTQHFKRFCLVKFILKLLTFKLLKIIMKENSLYFRQCKAFCKNVFYFEVSMLSSLNRTKRCHKNILKVNCSGKYNGNVVH